MIHPKLRAIPLANRQPGNLARIAAFGKGQPRSAATQEASTSFRPHIVVPDPRIREARDAYRAALQQRKADVEQAIANAAEPEEAEYWQAALKRLKNE